MSDLVERLRENDEMLRDGLQLPHLTEAWHNVVMKQTAKDCLEAADFIEALSSKNEEQALVIRELVEAVKLELQCDYPQNVSMYDEEGVDGWMWTHPVTGEEYTEIGDWSDPAPIPPFLEGVIARAAIAKA